MNMKHDTDFAAAQHKAVSAGSTSVAADQLLSIVQRIEDREAAKADCASDIKEIFAEAKSNGFDGKTLKKVVALRKKALEERQEEEAMLDLYLHALGMTS